MDLVCSGCGEPWELYYVLHEEPEGFVRKDYLIFRCPSCLNIHSLCDAAFLRDAAEIGISNLCSVCGAAEFAMFGEVCWKCGSLSGTTGEEEIK